MPKNAKGQDLLMLKDVKDVAQHYSQPCHHPLVGVFRLNFHGKETGPRVYGVYAVILINYTMRNWTYGRSVQKILCGSVITLSPGQFSIPTKPLYRDNIGIGLYFKRELLHGTDLGKVIDRFRYFEYMFNNSIFLNDKERSQYIKITSMLMEDLEKHGENLNLTYITKMIESLLMILEGAYSRCSDLCRSQTDDIFANFEHQLNDYLIFHDQHPKRIPMVSYFAKQAGLTHSHFGEAMKEMTSLTAQGYISYKMADYAKEWLMEDKEAREVASMLGFSDSPHFTRFFYAACGELPSDYKKRRTAELENAAEQFNSNEELKKRYESAMQSDDATAYVY